MLDPHFFEHAAHFHFGTPNGICAIRSPNFQGHGAFAGEGHSERLHAEPPRAMGWYQAVTSVDAVDSEGLPVAALSLCDAKPSNAVRQVPNHRIFFRGYFDSVSPVALNTFTSPVLNSSNARSRNRRFWAISVA
jgi:hypothetical protein